jgi:ribosomal protein S12 methylthiotransferase
MSASNTKHVSIITLGCAKNEVDSAHMTARLVEAGYHVLDWEEYQQRIDAGETLVLDALIVNTCSFLQAAIEESLEVIFDVANLPSVANEQTKLIVAGCMVSRFSTELQDELQEAHLFVPCNEENDIVRKLDQLLADTSSTSGEGPSPCDHAHLRRVDPGSSAYVKISDGCNRFCSFCAIPYIRGRYRSFSYETIFSEVEGLVEQGVKEIILIAQDTAIWGSDLEPKRTLAWLLDHIARSFPETWFRVLYIQPEYVDETLLRTIATHDNICNYLDIPFQHVDPALLRSMNRKGSYEDFMHLIDLIHEILPTVALRTTLIVGYPGETDQQFDDLCDFVTEIDFDYVGIFAFSPEEGTRAATLPHQIDDETKQERLRILRDLADTVSQGRLARFVGEELTVLALGYEEDGQLIGRSQYQAPDVDGVTYLDSGEPGEFIPVLIEDTLYYEMEGTRAR